MKRPNIAGIIAKAIGRLEVCQKQNSCRENRQAINGLKLVLQKLGGTQR